MAYNCVFCELDFNDFGNNPAPVKKKGRCCNRCNNEIIIPARLKEFFEEKKRLEK